MFGVGPLEIAFCALIILLVYGPDKLPTVARKVGRFVREFKQISDAITIAVRREMNNLERVAEEQEEKQKQKTAEKDTTLPLNPDEEKTLPPHVPDAIARD